ncbi:MAG: PEP-CTERM sorting domain-containing protein [Phycisphaeraceae bacterium]
MISVNLWSIGKPSSPSIWVDDANAPLSLQLDGATSAGAPGFETTAWENLDLGFPFGSSTAATTINGTGGTSATFEMLSRRNAAPYNWNPSTVRDDSDVLPGNEGNAALLDGHVNSTEFDAANGSGAPFGTMIGDYEIRDIPFATYDVVVYFGVNSGQQYQGNGNIRINDDVVRPTDLSGGWDNGVINDGGLDMSNATNFTLPTTAQSFEPDGLLDEIEFDGDTGNYIVFTGLTDPTFKFQTWGTAFTHLGAAGFQIMDAGGGIPGDTDGDGDIDDSDLGTAFSNYTGPLAPGTGGKTAADGDTDGDGDVDDSDLGTAFSGYTGPLGPASVPEPTSLALIGLGGLALIRRRRA